MNLPGRKLFGGSALIAAWRSVFVVAGGAGHANERAAYEGPALCHAES
jgi:hypothetical protein